MSTKRITSCYLNNEILQLNTTARPVTVSYTASSGSASSPSVSKGISTRPYNQKGPIALNASSNNSHSPGSYQNRDSAQTQATAHSVTVNYTARTDQTWTNDTASLDDITDKSSTSLDDITDDVLYTCWLNVTVPRADKQVEITWRQQTCTNHSLVSVHESFYRLELREPKVLACKRVLDSLRRTTNTLWPCSETGERRVI